MKRTCAWFVMLALALLCAAGALAEETVETKTERVNSPAADYAAGAYVTFGVYNESPVEWLVLDVDEENHRALLISRYVLDARFYNDPSASYRRADWSTSDMRAWLNGEFFEAAFTSEEREAVLRTPVDNSAAQQDPSDNYKNWIDTEDRVFLLSFAESSLYFASDEARMCTATDYAIAQGARQAQADDERNRVQNKPAAEWCLRSNKGPRSVFYVTISGRLFLKEGQKRDKFGVRPVLWIDLRAELPGASSPSSPSFPSSPSSSDPAEDPGTEEAASEERAPAAVAVGDVVTLGTWEQDRDTANGTEPIEWIVLETDGRSALLITRFGLLPGPYADNTRGQTWVNSVLRGTLNNDFYREAFTPEEQQAILMTDVPEGEDQQDPDHPAGRTGPDTRDHIFVLSYAETAKYFPSPRDRQCYVTPYARIHGNHSQGKMGEDYTCWYWLRTPAFKNNACVVDWDGRFETCVIPHPYGVARPCCRVDLTRLPMPAEAAAENSAEAAD